MARLVVLSEGYTGLAYELKVEKTSVGRVDDNAFQIADASVSSHHCEIIQQGTDILVRDLNSTNGSYINGEQITEKVLKPGQILRLGNIDVRLEVPPPAGGSGKKVVDKTTVIKQGVKLDEFEKGGKPVKFDTEGTFKKKSNKATKIFIGIVILVVVVIVVLLVIAVLKTR
jgi:pSer/pThr/pTyr-binding forkhead associated (FHA) protein